MADLSPQALESVAAYFRVLSEPTRLQILNLLRARECSVGELALQCGFTSANISRHLAQLGAHGLVARRNQGTSTYYRIADPAIYALCELVCDRIALQLDGAARQRALFVPAGGTGRRTAAARARAVREPS